MGKGPLIIKTRRGRGRAFAALGPALRDAFYNMALDKETMLNRFGQGRKPVLVRTNAIGLGIDMPDIRAVDVGMSRSLLDYAQEGGRVGRDGQKIQNITGVRSETVNFHCRAISNNFQGNKRPRPAVSEGPKKKKKTQTNKSASDGRPPAPSSLRPGHSLSRKEGQVASWTRGSGTQPVGCVQPAICGSLLA